MGGNKTTWLVGMMGAGKSAVGRSLASRLARPFVDSDAEVVACSGRSIPQIFENSGEAAFRELERDVVESLAGRELVVSLGGGVVAQAGMAAFLARTGTVVYLRAQPVTLLERVGDCAERPLLAGLEPEARLARLEALLAERSEAYETAEIVVDTDRVTLDDVVATLASKLAANA